jgi:septal ring factor EnvC (AmiA/AmiB activator)
MSVQAQIVEQDLERFNQSYLMAVGSLNAELKSAKDRLGQAEQEKQKALEDMHKAIAMSEKFLQQSQHNKDGLDKALLKIKHLEADNRELVRQNLADNQKLLDLQEKLMQVRLRR